MKKEFIVRTQGSVEQVKDQQHTYLIMADSPAEAAELVREAFKDDFGPLYPEQIYSKSETYPRQVRAIMACLCMGVAIFLLSFVKWYTETGRYPLKVGPSLETVLFGAIFYAAFVIRFKGIEQTVQTGLDITLVILNTLLLSGFISIILAEKSFQFLWFKTEIDSKYILVGAVALAWLGLKSVSAICLLLVVFIGLANLNVLSEAMSMWGTVYAMVSFIGILLYLSIEPAIVSAFPFYKKGMTTVMKQTRENMHSLGKDAKTVAQKGTKVMKKKMKGF